MLPAIPTFSAYLRVLSAQWHQPPAGWSLLEKKVPSANRLSTVSFSPCPATNTRPVGTSRSGLLLSVTSICARLVSVVERMQMSMMQCVFDTEEQSC